MMNPVHVLGASGRSGAALCRSLLADGVPLVPVVRNPARWAATGIAGAARADLTIRPPCVPPWPVHAGSSPARMRATPRDHRRRPADATLVLLGSTRKFTRWPDAHGNGVLAGEAALLASGRHGVMLHPTMIYGAQGEDNVQRLAGLLRRLPLLPLPGGGRFLVQPIHQSDVTRAIRAALDRDWQRPASLVIAGPAAVPYADFVRAVAVAAGLRQPRICRSPPLR